MGLPLVTLQVNGSPVLFILDSAGGCLLDSAAAASIGVKPTDTAMASGSGGMTSVELARGLALRLGELQLVPEFVVLAKLDGLGFSKPVRGILGQPLFGKYVVEIDYTGRRASVYEPSRFVPPKNAEALPMWMTDGPTVKGRVNVGGEEVEVDLQLDTGSAQVLTFCKPFVDANRLLEKVPGLVDGETQGIGGGSKDKVGRIRSLSLGRSRMDEPEVRFSVHGAGTLATDRFAANLGNGFLSRHRVTFDLPGKRFFLGPAGSTVAAGDAGIPGAMMRPGPAQ